VVPKQLRVTDTVDAFTEPKKVTQCNATITPIPDSCQNKSRGMAMTRRTTPGTKTKLRTVKPIRYQTKTPSSSVISRPRMAVSPKRSTAKWSSKYARFLVTVVNGGGVRWRQDWAAVNAAVANGHQPGTSGDKTRHFLSLQRLITASLFRLSLSFARSN